MTTKQQIANEAELLNKLNGYEGHKRIDILRAQLGLNKPKLVVIK